MNYNEADQKFDAAELEEMIRQLPETSQKVFNPYIIDGYNHKFWALFNFCRYAFKFRLYVVRK